MDAHCVVKQRRKTRHLATLSHFDEVSLQPVDDWPLRTANCQDLGPWYNYEVRAALAMGLIPSSSALTRYVKSAMLEGSGGHSPMVGVKKYRGCTAVCSATHLDSRSNQVDV